jgi:hypothetical protein
MKLIHHDLEIELDDSWWAEAGMMDFVRSARTYCVDPNYCMNREFEEIAIADIGPVLRAPGVGIFNDNPDSGSAHDRVVKILRGFRLGGAIPPVEVLEDKSGEHRYKLMHGTHRFYCSLAAGFTHVPTVRAIDWDTC